MNIESLPESLQALALGLIQDIFGVDDLLFAKYLLASLLILLAVILFLLVLRILRSDKKTEVSQEKNIPQTLLKTGTTVELCNQDEVTALRCVLVRAGRKKIKCDIIERLDELKAGEGELLTGIFPPLIAAGRKVNTFSATILESDKKGKKTNQITLSTPERYSLSKRRQQARKRVVDQQFIRVKLWLADPAKNDIHFQDAAPDIGVNSYAQDNSGHDSNSVINISKGGIALKVRNQLLPPACAVGSSTVINIFMFSFKEKIFRPYWYTGEVRSMEEANDEGYTRLGVSFTRSGWVNESTGTISWE